MITGGFDVVHEEEAGHEDEGEAPMELSEAEEDEKPAAAAEKPEEQTEIATVKLANGEEKKVEVLEGKEIVEADRKKVDVIAMIRAAKKAAEKEVRKDEVAAGDDFISFGAMDDKPEKDDESDFDDHRKQRKLNDSSKASIEDDADPNKPFSFKEQLHGVYTPANDEGPPGVGPLSRNAKLPPPPGPGKDTRKALKRRRGRDDYSDESDFDDEDDYDPSSLVFDDSHREQPDIPASRKRKHDEISRGNAKIDGNIKRELRPKMGINHIPWMTAGTDHSRTLKLSMWYVPTDVRMRPFSCFLGFTWK